MIIKKLFFISYSLLFNTAYVLTSDVTHTCTTPMAPTCNSLLAHEPKNLHDLKQEIIQYHESGLWEKARECKAQEAQALLQKYIPVGAKKLAVVFDIDDTSLASWDFNLKENFGYNIKRYLEWEMAAELPSIKSILKLYHFAQQHGFAVFFITGRREKQRTTTEANLLKEGFTHWNGLFFKPQDYKGRHVSGPKSTWRKHIQEQGYTIVLNVGDQETDFIGYPQAMHNIKLPNPMYKVP